MHLHILQIKTMHLANQPMLFQENLIIWEAIIYLLFQLVEAQLQVWSGTVSSGTAVGNGTLTEFCIHKDHPYLKNLGTVSQFDVDLLLGLSTNPVYEFSVNTITDTLQKYLPFSQAVHFNTSAEAVTNEFGVPYYAQAERVTPEAPYAYSDKLYAALNTFPIKIGFGTGDDYLIGKKNLRIILIRNATIICLNFSGWI